MLVTNTTPKPISYNYCSETRTLAPKTSVGLSGAEAAELVKLKLPGVKVGVDEEKGSKR